MKWKLPWMIVVVAAVGCSGVRVRTPTATATLAPTKGQQVSGKVDFTQTQNGVLVEARVTGLTPGRHGFHIHERGNCTGDAAGAGAHFNPLAAAHGALIDGARHAGDLGNLDADASGVATYRAEVTGISLGTGEDSIIGRAVIVHERADDLTTQPAGNAGARQACGLVSKSADKWF
ncbi:MAG TPA: superoxide dismutase family protein [Burkholderiales bacterium]|nr:superoxide dismutase family protein [Burkholderiales bacterium]